MRNLREVRLAGLGIGLRRTVEKSGANPGFAQSLDCGVGVRGGWIVVAPINESGCAAVQLIQSADKRGDADIFGIESRREAGVDPAKIFEQRPVR